MTTTAKEERLFEIVHFTIHDVGRAIDLSRLVGAAADAESFAKRMGNETPARRDTPASLLLPRPLRFPLRSVEADGFGELSSEAKIYDDGAITVSSARSPKGKRCTKGPPRSAWTPGLKCFSVMP